MTNYKTAYSLDDFLLVPQYSEVASRLDTDVSTPLTITKRIDVPIMATNMSTISGYKMLRSMWREGGVAALHRFNTIDEQIEELNKARHNTSKYTIASVGVGLDEYQRGKRLIDEQCHIIFIDVAHGHSEGVIEQLIGLKSYGEKVATENYKPEFIVGNIATAEAAKILIDAGADALRVGIGPGSRCLTRTVTGHGVPNATALMDVVAVRNYNHSKTGEYVPVIIDGGIKNSGDIVKALYFGADIACIGYLFAGTEETPGETLHTEGSKVKKFYGMASKEAQDVHRGGMKTGTAAEGFSETVPYKGSVRPIVQDLVGGVRSGLTYSGAKSIPELRQKGEAILLTPAAQYESKFFR